MTRSELKERRKEIDNIVEMCDIATADYLKEVILNAAEYKLYDFAEDSFFKDEVKEARKAVKEARKSRNLYPVRKAFETLGQRLNRLV